MWRSQRGNIGYVVAEGVAGPQGGFTVTEYVPGEPDMRAKIAVINVVEATKALSQLKEADAGDKVRRPVLEVPKIAIDVVTQAESQRQPGSNLPIVLRVEADRILNQI